MAEQVGEISGTVLSVTSARGFSGKAIVTHVDPQFVVALLLENSSQADSLGTTNIVLPTYRVVFFAIHSVAQTFETGDEVLGNDFRLRIRMETVDGGKRYQLERK